MGESVDGETVRYAKKKASSVEEWQEEAIVDRSLICRFFTSHGIVDCNVDQMRLKLFFRAYSWPSSNLDQFKF